MKLFTLHKSFVCLVAALGAFALIGCSNSATTSANTSASSSEAAQEQASASAQAEASASDQDETSTSAQAEAAASSAQAEASGTATAAVQLADGDYTCEADTDSSMFRIEECTLHVEGGSYSATISLPGEGFSRLYFGTAEEAAGASDSDIYDYYLNDSGKYTFDIPVSALDEEIQVAAFGHRRDTWYDHTITIFAPAEGAAAAA